MKVFGTSRLPGPLHERLARLTGERPLAWASTPDGGAVVGTQGTLVVLGAADQLVGWHEIVRSSWAGETSTLRWTGRTGRRESVMLADAGRIPELVHERVQASIVVQRTVTVARHRTVVVSGRRNLSDGEIDWTVDAGPGTDLSDPAIAAEATRSLADLRAEYVL